MLLELPSFDFLGPWMQGECSAVAPTEAKVRRSVQPQDETRLEGLVGRKLKGKGFKVVSGSGVIVSAHDRLHATSCASIGYHSSHGLEWGGAGSVWFFNMLVVLRAMKAGSHLLHLCGVFDPVL